MKRLPAKICLLMCFMKRNNTKLGINILTKKPRNTFLQNFLQKGIPWLFSGRRFMKRLYVILFLILLEPSHSYFSETTYHESAR
jgi:hypothetical protein